MKTEQKEIMEFVKAQKGQELAGHKYFSRKQKPGGGYIYKYSDAAGGHHVQVHSVTHYDSKSGQYIQHVKSMHKDDPSKAVSSSHVHAKPPSTGDEAKAIHKHIAHHVKKHNDLRGAEKNRQSSAKSAFTVFSEYAKNTSKSIHDLKYKTEDEEDQTYADFVASRLAESGAMEHVKSINNFMVDPHVGVSLKRIIIDISLVSDNPHKTASDLHEAMSNILHSNAFSTDSSNYEPKVSVNGNTVAATFRKG